MLISQFLVSPKQSFVCVVFVCAWCVPVFDPQICLSFGLPEYYICSMLNYSFVYKIRSAKLHLEWSSKALTKEICVQLVPSTRPGNQGLLGIVVMSISQ